MSNNVGEWSLQPVPRDLDMYQAHERIQKLVAAVDIQAQIVVLDDDPIDGAIVIDDELYLAPAGDGLWTLELVTHHPGNSYRPPENDYEHIAGPVRLESVVVHALSKLVMMRVSHLLERETDEHMQQMVDAAQETS